MTNVTIGNSVTNIGDYSFRSSGLTSQMIPASVTNIGSYAFEYCDDLTSVTFEGNTPDSFGVKVFSSVAVDFKIYFYEGATGFTTPIWNGYPCEKVGSPYHLVTALCIGSGTVAAPGYWNDAVLNTVLVVEGTVLDLEAVPEAGWFFTGWSGDLLDDFAEWVAGTSPTNDASSLAVEFPEDHAYNEISWNGVSDRYYQLVYTTQLGEEWIPVGDVGVGADELITRAVDDGLSNCFFRVRCSMDPADFGYLP